MTDPTITPAIVLPPSEEAEAMLSSSTTDYIKRQNAFELLALCNLHISRAWNPFHGTSDSLTDLELVTELYQVAEDYLRLNSEESS